MSSLIPASHPPQAPAVSSANGDSVGGVEKRTLLDLPSGMLIDIMDDLSPVEQIAAAQACSAMMAASNKSCLKLVPPDKRDKISWRAQFHSLPRRTQAVLKATDGIFPCPDIFSPIDPATEAAHRSMAFARKQADALNTHGMDACLVLTAQFAKQAGMQMPEHLPFAREARIKGVHVNLAMARQAAQKNRRRQVETALGGARSLAEQAGVPLPEEELAEIGHILECQRNLALSLKCAKKPDRVGAYQFLKQAADCAKLARVKLTDATFEKIERALNQSERR